MTVNSEMISNEFVAIDVETTGLNSDKDEIVEVAAIKFNSQGEVLDTFYSLCRPLSGVIPVEASNVHGILMSKVIDEKPYSEIRAEVAAFVGKRTLIGHNLIGFDIKFLKLQPVEMHDTLLMARERWPNKKNNLALACKSAEIPFNKEEAHGALYDTKKCMELYLHLIKKDGDLPMQTSLLEAPVIASTQVYSYSRINTFHTCPYKWSRIYLHKEKEPERSYFTVGKVMHKIAQISAMWCYMSTFGNRFNVFANKTGWKAPKELLKLVEIEVGKHGLYLPKSMSDVNTNHIGMFLYRNHGYIQTFFGRTIIGMIEHISGYVNDGEYEIVGMPDDITYARIIHTSLAIEKCTDEEAIKDIMWMAEFFHKQKDFALSPNEVAIVEKQMVFDKDWKVLKNWFDNDAFIRGALDVVEYNGNDHITILDYKTSRKMLTPEQLMMDLQLKTYVLFIHKYMPSVKSATIKHHYMRYGKVVSVTIPDISIIALEAEAWVRSSIEEIETEMLKPEKEAFLPRRNEFCFNCFLMENNKCPLFSVKTINDIEDPANFTIKSLDDFKQAWKKIEVNQAEIKNLTAKCKSYMKQVQGRVVIDEKASVDFWVKEDVKYDPVKTTKLLLDKKISLKDVLNEVSLSKTSVEKLLKRNKISLSTEEESAIVEKVHKTEFDAKTKEELEGYING